MIVVVVVVVVLVVAVVVVAVLVLVVIVLVVIVIVLVAVQNLTRAIIMTALPQHHQNRLRKKVEQYRIALRIQDWVQLSIIRYSFVY